MAAADEALEAQIARRRLSAAAQRERRRFTVDRAEGLMRLRARAREEPWRWTVPLLRAGRVASPSAMITASSRREGELEVVEIELVLPDADLATFDAAAAIEGALEADVGVVTNAGPDVRAAAFRRLVGRAINDALAHDPVRVELVGPNGARVWTRRSGEGGRDPYEDRAAVESTAGPRIVVRFAAVAGLGSRLGGWFAGRDARVLALDELWRAALLAHGAEDRAATGVALGAAPPGPLVALGQHATWGTWGRDRANGGLWFVRDGVRVRPLDDLLARAGLPVREMSGWIDCPSLRLTVDEGAVVEDEALALLVAWLHDALAHASADGERTIGWPTTLTHVRAGSGAAIGLDVLADTARARGDVLFTWAHEVAKLPEAMRTRVVSLWPSERELLRTALPDLRLVPARALGDTPSPRPIDLGSLAQGCFPPLPIPIAPFSLGEGDDLILDLAAWIHRNPDARDGSILVLAWDRRVGHVTDPRKAIAGVTLVARVVGRTGGADPPSVGTMQADVERLRRLAQQCQAAAESVADLLLGHAIAHGGGTAAAWEIPFVRMRVETANAWTLRVRYVMDAGAPRLRWADSPLLLLEVGRKRDGGPCTLGDALARARDTGGLVTTEAARTYFSLERGPIAPVVPDERARTLIERVIGDGATWSMPVVPEALPHPTPAASQRHLLLDREETGRLLGRTSTDARARSALLAHLAIARALGADEQGLDSVALVRRYDPRALAPTRLVTLASVLTESPRPLLVPCGAVARALPTPVLEVAPGEAALLHEVFGLEPSALERGDVATEERARPIAARRRGSDPDPILTIAITDPLAAGALHLAAETGGITLWAKGLRVGDFSLPAPLESLSGRLWLTDAGIRKGFAPIQKVALAHGRAMVATATDRLVLVPPASERRRALERFLAHCRAAVAAGHDAAGIAALLQGDEPADAVAGALAPARLPGLVRVWLPLLLRHALGRPVETETAWLQWKAAKLRDKDHGPQALGKSLVSIELGSRHDWIARALADDAHPRDAYAAAALVVAEIADQAGVPSDEVAIALARILATSFAGPRT